MVVVGDGGGRGGTGEGAQPRVHHPQVHGHQSASARMPCFLCATQRQRAPVRTWPNARVVRKSAAHSTSRTPAAARTRCRCRPGGRAAAAPALAASLANEKVRMAAELLPMAAAVETAISCCPSGAAARVTTGPSAATCCARWAFHRARGGGGPAQGAWVLGL
jgi:hypothetical protein